MSSKWNFEKSRGFINKDTAKELAFILVIAFAVAVVLDLFK